LAEPPFDKGHLARAETAAEKRARIFKDGTEVLSEHQEAAINIRKNMARLRELRLAKEAADRATEGIAAKPASNKPASKKAPTKSTKTR
jgi:hypothetical protein